MALDMVVAMAATMVGAMVEGMAWAVAQPVSTVATQEAWGQRCRHLAQGLSTLATRAADARVVALLQAKSVAVAVWLAAMVVLEVARWPTWAMDKVGTFKTPPTDMLAAEATST